MLIFCHGSGASFDPTTIAGMQVWLDPADNGKVVQSGGKCSQLTDKSGVGNHFVQATGSKQMAVTAGALDGKQALTANSAAATWMTCTLAGTIAPFTILIVVKPTTNVADTDGFFTSYVNAGDVSICAGATNSAEAYAFGTGRTAVTGNNTFNTGTIYVLGLTYATAGTGHIISSINNVQKTDSTQGFVARQIGAACGYGGSPGWTVACNAVLGDLMIYNSVLSSTDLGHLYNNYFKPKYSSLP